jgi:DNA-binding response OmpR family regulator
VVVLDDEPAVLTYLGRLLRTRGLTVYECATAEEASTRCEVLEGRIDLFVADLVMPGATGRDVGERLRSKYPHLSVLYISGFSDDEMMQRGLLTPGDAFMQKPFSSDELLERVRALLERDG